MEGVLGLSSGLKKLGGQSAGQQHQKMLLVSFQSQTQRVAPRSVTGHLVHIVNRL